MKNMYIQLGFGVLIAIFSVLPMLSEASSFVPTGRTYYPQGNAQPITIVNNNYNNNVNTNTVKAPAVQQYTSPVMYAGTTADQYRGGANIHTIAQNNLPIHATYTTTKAKTVAKSTLSTCTTCAQASSYRLAKQLDCGATVAIAQVRVSKPTCSLVPSINSTGAIELQWTTSGATVAYLDNGIGHINTITGKRVVTPSKDTAYNLTVLNDTGIAGTCGARVNVSMGKGGTLAVTATNGNYNYSLNTSTNGQRASLTTSNSTTTTSTTQNTGVNTSGMDTVGIESTEEVDTSTRPTLEASEGTAGLFGTTFKKIAIPIGIVFLILIVLLIFIMSKVKAAK